MIFPWQTENWRQALRYLKHKRLAHAVLLSGPAAIGKLGFCLSLIQRLNCTNPVLDDHACGECKDCRLFSVNPHPDIQQNVYVWPDNGLSRANIHPDIRLINIYEDELDKNKTEQVKVDYVREINHFMTLSRLQGNYKIVCINHAETMNENAANALLKILEEPLQNSILFLISHRADILPPTIRSRCQIWKFNLPEETQSLAWLEQRGGDCKWPALLKVARYRPLRALELQQSGLGEYRIDFYKEVSRLLHGKINITGVSARHQDVQLERLVGWQQSWCADLIRCHYENEPVTLENPDIRRSLHSLVGRVDLHSLFRFMDRLVELRRFSSAPLNKRLFIEDMLIRCQEVLKQPV